jgi:hypothetical protein
VGARTQKYRFGLSWPSCLFSGRIFQFTIRLPVNQTSSADCVCMCAHACTKIQIWIKLAFLPFLWKNFSIHNQTSSESDFQCRLCVCVCVCVCTEIQIWIKLAFLPFLWKNFSIHNQTSSESDFQCRLCVCVCVCVYRNTDLD